MSRVLSLEQATRLAADALESCGADRGTALSVARSVVAAQARGRSNVGFDHLPFYCDALRRAAVNGRAVATVTRPAPGHIHVDAGSGFTHPAFDAVLEEFHSAAVHQGVAVLTIANTFTCGELGYFPDLLARGGLISLAATNAGPAAITPSGAGAAVFSTNPLAWAFPRASGPPLLVDQSTSACTLVDLHAARRRGVPIPDNWALDRRGRPTDNPDAALQGSLLPFGGRKGANFALLVELLAAGLTGANWSLEAPSFSEDPDCPDVGQWFLAMDPASFDQGNSRRRIDRYLQRLEALGVYIPGQRRAEQARTAENEGIILADDLFDIVHGYTRSSSHSTHPPRQE